MKLAILLVLTNDGLMYLSLASDKKGGLLKMGHFLKFVEEIFALVYAFMYIDKPIGENMKVDVLAFGAHPDDVEITCAGTVAKLVRGGKQVAIIDLTQGELGTRGSKSIREKEAEEAGRILGIAFRENLKIPDGNIEVNKKNMTRIIETLRAYRPDVILFPHSLERHPDHEHTFRLCKEAWFYAGLEKISTRVNGRNQEPFRPKKYFHFMQKYEFAPSFIVDVSDVYELKTQSLHAYESQFHNPRSKERETLLSSKIFLEYIKARDLHYGSLINVEFGEPFFSIEPIGVDSLFELKM